MGVTNMQKKLLSNRGLFKQLLARDILAVLEDLNAGTWCDLATVRQHLMDNTESSKFYMNNCSAEGYTFTGFDDRFYRAIQSVNDSGYGLTVRKDKQTKRLYAFNTNFANNFVETLADAFDDWTVNYNRGNK